MAILLKLTLTAICVCMLQPNDCVGVLNWLWGSGEEEAAVSHKRLDNEFVNTDVSSVLAKIPFELQPADEKFFNEATKLTDMTSSQLDGCHHKIILGLKKSCAQLTEEEIAKLSVNLLNCQSAVEGRSIFPCTNSMTIKECTSKMDRDTWNAYHIVSNRARAVCYGSRQIQFKAKTEMAVNKLVNTAEQQLIAMNMLQEGQEKLGKVTEDTLESISVGHRNLMLQQEMLKSAQDSIKTYVASNLRHLTAEKALIAAGQKELSLMTESIKEKLDKAQEQLASQEDDRKKNHNEILSDLAELQQKAKSVWEKIENSTAKILDQHAASVEHYQTALENLKRVNESIGYLLVLVERTRSEIDAKLEWLTHVAGGTGNQLVIVASIMGHVGYFLLAAITMSFINAPLVTRIALVVAVPLNLLNEVKNGLSLDFIMLTVIVLLSMLMHWLSAFIKRSLNKRSSRRILDPDPPKLTNPQANVHSHHFSSNNSRHLPPSSQFSDESEEDADVTVPPINILKASNLGLHSNSAFTNVKPKNSDGINSSIMQLSDSSPESNPLIKNPNDTFSTGAVHILQQDDGVSDSSPKRLTRRSISRSSTPLRNGSPVTKMCQAQNKSGFRCRNSVVSGRSYCYLHLESNS